MNALNCIKNAFVITNKNLILAQPFILFLLMFSILSGGLVGAQKNPVTFLGYFLILALLLIAFGAGWFYMAKKTISFQLRSDLSEEEKILQSYGLIKHFFPGVGEYFLPMIGLSVVLMLASIFTMAVTYKLGVKLIGPVSVDFGALNSVSASVGKINSYFATLSYEKLKNLVYWTTYISLVSMLFQFVSMWFLPALFYESKNPFKAIWCGLKFLGRNFFPAAGVGLFLFVFNIFVSFANAFGSKNVILSLIGFLIFFYFVTYYVVLIFLYYGQNGAHTAKDYINSGNDSDGEKLAGSEAGKED